MDICYVLFHIISLLHLCVTPQVLADAVSHLVIDKFSKLTDNFRAPHAQRKVLAGVVMTAGILVAQVIS